MLFKKLMGVLLAAALLAGCASDGGSSEHTASEGSSQAVTAAPPVTLQPVSSAEENSLPEPPESDIAPAMWECTSENGARVVFMGSMHALKEEAYPLPSSVTGVLDSSDILAVECDISQTTSTFTSQMKQLQNMYYADGDTVENHISPEVVKGFKEFALSCGTDLSMYDGCQAWVYAALAESIVMSQTDLDLSLGIDIQLLQRAHELNKEILELETADYQTELFMGFSDELFEVMLSSYTAENKDALVADLEQSYTAWATGDVDKMIIPDDASQLTGAAGEKISEKAQKVLDEYNEHIIFERNVNMAQKAKELIDGGRKAFYIVGSNHLCGERGIFDLLEEQGYEVKRIQ